MPRSLCVFILFVACSLAIHAHIPAGEPLSVEQQQPWWNRLWNATFHNLAFLNFWAPVPSWEESAALLPPPEPCAIEPLPPVEEDALAFENSASPIDVSGLTPGAARALQRFERRIALAGGTLVLTSAYRPPAYQRHLAEVWDRWMALRDNQDYACTELKAYVGEEFTRHELLETQRPVAFSDHTRGLAFDAAVTLPSRARVRRRVTVDRLAAGCHLRRPDVVRDPVHFKFTS
jgi:hypothetical protein